MDKLQKYLVQQVPQFSFSRLGGADVMLGVEMASTGLRFIVFAILISHMLVLELHWQFVLVDNIML